MRHTRFVWVLVTMAAACGPTVQEKVPAFPTTHVTLYDCGLAQVERQAEVQGATGLEIDVESAHLDDLLATLVLATDGDVKVSGVKFPGVQNLGQAVASSGFAGSMLDGSGGLEMPSDLEGYARALVGTHVSITTSEGEEIDGTVLDAVVPPTPSVAEGEVAPMPEPIMVVVTGEGALRWLPVGSVMEVMPTSGLEAAAIKNFATALGQASGFAQTKLELNTTKDSKGKLAASYVRQIPVWRMLYKTSVLQGKVILEAWAVVHNDTPEDWTDVSMTLVSGLPTSYVFSVASPRYQHRDVIEAPGATGEMMPQLGAQSPDTLLYEWDIYHASSGFGYGAYGAGGGGYGYGSSSPKIMGSYGQAGYASEMGSSLLTVGESAAEETMVAEVEDEISTYTAMNAVTMPSGTNSLVPLIRRELPGQAFTLIDGNNEPATCVRIENTTGLVLQPGMSTFYINGKFRGQDDIDRLEPGDVRVLCYGFDQDIAPSHTSRVDDRYTALEFKNGILWTHSLRTTTHEYAIENFAGQSRDLAIEVSHIQNGKVVSPEDLVGTDSPTTWLYLLAIPARIEVEQELVVEEGVMTQTSLTTYNFDKLVEAKTLPDEQVDVLKKVRPVLEDMEELDRKMGEMRDEVNQLNNDIQWKKDLLATVPETEGKSKSVDSILAEIMKAKKKMDGLEEEIEKLGEQKADLREKAKEQLEVLKNVQE